MRSARVELMNDYIKDLSEVEVLATEYWHETTLLPSDDSKRSIIAAKLRGKLHAARHFKASADKFLGSDMQKFNDLDIRLFMAATGGEFETKKARQDFQRADDVMSTCGELRALIRLARRKAYWAR